jgi:hypothetical protein
MTIKISSNEFKVLKRLVDNAEFQISGLVNITSNKSVHEEHKALKELKHKLKPLTGGMVNVSPT